jgi:hypothetical protein
MRQITSACQPSFEKYARASRRGQFLQTMESVVPWSELEALIEPHYPKAGKGRQPVGLGIIRAFTFYSTGSICRTPAPRMHSTTRPRCATSLSSICHPTDEDLSAGTSGWAARQRPARAPF